MFVVEVECDGDTGNLLPLNLEIYPTREAYSINIMCEDFADQIVTCESTTGTVRGFAPPEDVGCTVVGDGQTTNEDQITALCQGAQNCRGSKSSKGFK